jgi:hypothetical protein
MRLNGPRNKMYGISANRVAVNSQRVDKLDSDELINTIKHNRH